MRRGRGAELLSSSSDRRRVDPYGRTDAASWSEFHFYDHVLRCVDLRQVVEDHVDKALVGHASLPEAVEVVLQGLQFDQPLARHHLDLNLTEVRLLVAAEERDLRAGDADLIVAFDGVLDALEQR